MMQVWDKSEGHGHGGSVGAGDAVHAVVADVGYDSKLSSKGMPEHCW